MIFLLLQLWQIDINGETIANDAYIMIADYQNRIVKIKTDNIFTNGFEL